ncbi:fimbrial protein [Escherichia coli O8:H49]
MLKNFKFLVAVFYTLSFNSYSVDNLEFTGELVVPVCTINDGQTIQTDWGDIEVQEFKNKDTPYFIKEIKINIKCPYYYGRPIIKLSGQKHTTPGERGIKTTKYDEGLLVYLGLKNGYWLSSMTDSGSHVLTDNDITGSGSDKLLTVYASLGRYKNIESLTPGPWSATANMEIYYQ